MWGTRDLSPGYSLLERLLRLGQRPLMRLGRVSLLLLVIVIALPKQFCEKSFFLLFLLVRWRRCWSRLSRSSCRLRARRLRGQSRHSVYGRSRSHRGLFANTKKLLENISLIAGDLVAGLRRRGPVEKHGIVSPAGNWRPRADSSPYPAAPSRPRRERGTGAYRNTAATGQRAS